MTALEASPSEQTHDHVIVDVRETEPQDQPAGGRNAGSRARFPSRGAIVTVISAVLGVLAVWFILYAFVLTDLQERSAQARLYDSFRLALAGATAPIGGSIRAGTPVALLTAKGAGIHDLVVVEGSTANELESGPGHLSNTPLPGQAGTSWILGRSVTFGSPFRDISHMKVGDTITATTGQGAFSYEVYDVRRPGQRLPKPLGPNQSGLTLVTSASRGWGSGWAPSSTVYVDAILVRHPVAPAPAGRPTTVSKASLPMQGDSHGVVSLIFWVEALIVVAGLTVWAWARWGRKQTWLVGAPVVLLVLWGTTGALIQLMPNLV